MLSCGISRANHVHSILTSLLREVECFYGLALIYYLFVPHRWEWFDTRCSQQFQFNTTPRYFLTCLSKVKLSL